MIRARGYDRFGLSLADMLSVTFHANELFDLQRMARGETVTIPDTAVEARYGETIFGFVMLDSATPGTFDERATPMPAPPCTTPGCTAA